MKRPLAASLLFLCLLACLLAPGAARSEDLVAGLSTDLIEITSDFTGAEFVVFGAIEGTDNENPTVTHDVMVVIRGPDVDLTVRRKDRFLGIWINREQIPFSGMPGYYFTASSRPLNQIANPATLARFQFGSANLPAQPLVSATPQEIAAFKAAAVRSLEREHLYGDAPGGVEFLSRTLFRARIPVPAITPPGQYRAEVYLFRNGDVVSAQSTPLFIDKTGIERQIYNFAYEASLSYGLITVAMAFLAGWLGYLVFRQRLH